MRTAGFRKDLEPSGDIFQPFFTGDPRYRGIFAAVVMHLVHDSGAHVVGGVAGQQAGGVRLKLFDCFEVLLGVAAPAVCYGAEQAVAWLWPLAWGRTAQAR
jgi:hypothetical protein